MSFHGKVPALQQETSKKNANRKLLYVLLLFFVTLLAVLFFRSEISRITAIDVSGNRFVTTEQVIEAAMLEIGEHYFAAHAATIQKRVKSLEIIDSVHVNKHFPGRIAIEVKEYDDIAFEMTESGNVDVIFANGSSAAITSGSPVIDKPILTGWSARDPMKVKLCEALALIPASKLSDISEIRPDPSPAFADKIKLYTRSRFTISTTITFLHDKMEVLDDYIYELVQNDSTSRELILLESDYIPSVQPGTDVEKQSQ